MVNVDSVEHQLRNENDNTLMSLIESQLLRPVLNAPIVVSLVFVLHGEVNNG